MKLFRLALSAALVLAFAVSAAAQTLFVDDAGRTVALPDKIERVMAAGPPASVLLYALAPDRLVGWVRAPSDEEKAFIAEAYHDLPEHGRLTGRGGTAIMVCTMSGQHSFARATGALDELGLNILDARVVPVGDGRNVHTYVVLESDGAPIEGHDRVVQIENALRKATLEHGGRMPTVSRQPPRQVRLFSTPTRIGFSEDRNNRRTVMELVAADRPGLLCEVGKAFVECGVSLRAAKIMTVGERAEDVFYITTLDGEMLEDAARRELERQLKARLDQPSAPR